MEAVANTYNSCILCKNSLIDRNAYLMPCIHSVCESCLKVTEKSNVDDKDDGKVSPVSIVNLADEITCTDCKEKYQVADMVENLLTRKLSEPPIVIEEVEKHICAGCDDSIEATSHCDDCDDWLCDQCVFAHKRVKITKDHTITGRNNTGTKDGKANDAATFCKLHKHEKYQFFCESCDMLTCRDCQLVDHKEHKYMFLSEAATIYKNQAERFAQLLQAKKDTLKLSATKIQEKLTYVKSQKDIVRDEVQLQARKLVEHVIEYAKQILQNLNFVCDAAGKRLAQEGAEASAMLQKIDHLATFLKSLKNEKNDLNLLYTKKLILTQATHLAQVNLELYSLKGQLNLEYRHDSPFFFTNLHKLGTIFVNGLRYPPPKNQQGQPQPMIQQPTHNGSNTAISDDQRKAMAYAMQRAAMARQQQQQQHQQQQQQHPQYNARMAAIQQQQHQHNRQINHANIHANNQNNVLRSNQPGNNLPFNWQNNNRSSQSQQQVSAAHNPTSGANVRLLSHVLLQQQAGRHQPPPQQQFQPMKLNTRPVSSNVAANMTLNQSLPSWNGSQGNSPRTGETGYPGIIATDSSNGKVEDDFYDCIITAAKIKGQKLEDHVGLFTGDESNTINLVDDFEADNVLSDVLKNMPIELTQSNSPQNTDNNDNETDNATIATPSESTEDLSENPKPSYTETLPPPEQSKSDIPEENIFQEITVLPSSQPDPNEDYCACCHNGGDVLCCDQCPRVYHLHCHIPPLQCVPLGVFVCALCDSDHSESITTVDEIESDFINGGTKRKAPSGLSNKELKICEKILLELFCHQQSVAFHEPVGRNVLNYHKIVTKPQDFTTIKCKLAPQHFNHYNSLCDFLSDLKQVFINCALYNAPESEVGKSGRAVRKFFEDLVAKNFPAYLKFVKMEVATSPLPLDTTGNSSPKRLRLDEEMPTS